MFAFEKVDTKYSAASAVLLALHLRLSECYEVGLTGQS